MMLVSGTGRPVWWCGAWLAGVVLASTCARSEPANELPSLPAPAAAETGLIVSLEARYANDSVQLALHVTNGTEAPMELEFGSTQRYDFSVLNAAGESAWTWSADRSFAQALGTETLAAGATVHYEAIWEPVGGAGVYTAVGQLVSTNKPIEMRTQFEIPGR